RCSARSPCSSPGRRRRRSRETGWKGRPTRRRSAAMASRVDGPLGLVAGAARGAASIPARAAANVARDRLEDVADAMLASPGTLRAVDRVLAGPLPEEIVRSAVRNRVLERMLSELAASGALDELVSGALESRQSQALVDRIVASEEMQRVMRDVLTSPEVRHALVDQT